MCTSCLRSLIVTMVLICQIQQSRSCTCLPVSSQNAYCESDFVVAAYIQSVTVRPREVTLPGDPTPISISDRVYTAYVSVYKDRNSTLLYVTDFHTPESSAACGITLDVGEWYLLTGKVRNGEHTVILCNWFSKWTDLTLCQYNALSPNNPNGYSANCDCAVSVCFSAGGDMPTCFPEATDKHCVINDDNCLNDHATCVQNGAGTCEWDTCYGYNICSVAQPVNQV